MVTLEQSVRIYAQASRAWFGHNAVQQARRKADECREKGDNEGVDVWLRVKDEVERLERIGAPRFSVVPR